MPDSLAASPHHSLSDVQLRARAELLLLPHVSVFSLASANKSIEKLSKS